MAESDVITDVIIPPPPAGFKPPQTLISFRLVPVSGIGLADDRESRGHDCGLSSTAPASPAELPGFARL